MLTGRAADELDLTVYSRVGDTVALEYPVGHLGRIRGAGFAADGRETNAVGAIFSLVAAGITAAGAPAAVILDRREPPRRRAEAPER